MAATPTTPIRIFSALAIACAMAAISTQPAVAQTATKLSCTGCVKSKHIKDNNIKSKDIEDGQVLNSDIGNNAVNSAKIQDGTVNSEDIADGTVGNADLADNAVNGAKVAGGSLTAIHLGDEAGVDFVGGIQGLLLHLNVDTVVRSIDLTAPESGFVILNASGAFTFSGNAEVECSLTTGSTLEDGDRQFAGRIADAHRQFFGMTEGFVVPAGTTALNLVCRATADTVVITDSDLTAIYTPTRY